MEGRIVKIQPSHVTPYSAIPLRMMSKSLQVSLNIRDVLGLSYLTALSYSLSSCSSMPTSSHSASLSSGGGPRQFKVKSCRHKEGEDVEQESPTLRKADQK